MPVDDRAAQEALDRLIAALPAATAKVSEGMANEVRREAQGNLKDPMGPLAQSIIVTGPDLRGKATYRSQTGPTLVYGRQRELGGSIEPTAAEFLTAHYRAPGYWMWDFGHGLEDVFALNVFQEGQHYLKRGVETSIPRLNRIAAKIWGDILRLAL